MNPIQIILTGDAKGAVNALNETQRSLAQTYNEAGKSESALAGLGLALGGTLVAGAAAAAAAFAAVGAAAKMGLDSLVEWNEQVDRLTHSFGLSGEAASQYAAFFQHFGVPVEEAGMQINFLVRQLGELDKAQGTTKTSTRATADEIEKMGQRMADAQERLRRAEERLGTAEKPTKAMKYAVDDARLAVERLGQEMEKAGQLVTSTTTKTTPLSEALKTLGVSAYDAHGKMKSIDVLFPQLLDKFAKMPEGIEKANLAMALFGTRGGSKFADVLTADSKKLAEFMQKTKEFGLMLTTEQSDRIEAFGFTMNDLGMRFEGLKVQVGLAVLPIAEDLVAVLGPAITNAKDVLVKFLDAFTVFRTELGKGANPFDALITAVGGLKDILGEDYYTLVISMLDGLSAGFADFKIWAEKEVPPAMATFQKEFGKISETNSQMGAFALLIGETLPKAYDRFKIAFSNAGGSADKKETTLADIIGGIMSWFNEGQARALGFIVGQFEVMARIVKGDLPGAFTAWWTAMKLFLPDWGGFVSKVEDGAKYLLGVKLNTEGAKRALGELASNMGGIITGTIKGFVDGPLTWLKDRLGEILGVIGSILSGLQQIGGSFGLGGGGGNGGGRASGGHVFGGTSYLVGERGPELFTPGSSGYITPNHKLGGGVTLVYAPTISLADEYEARTKLMPFIRAALRGA